MIFAKIHGSDNIRRVQDLSSIVRKHFEAAGFIGDEDKPFKPHLTICKMSKAKTLYRKVCNANGIFTFIFYIEKYQINILQ